MRLQGKPFFFLISFTKVRSHKFRSRLQSTSFPVYKTEARKVTQQVGLHGIPLSSFSRLFSQQALPAAIV